jgi:hypothetical protein
VGSPPPTQIHDFNPGIHPYPLGLFWTVAIPPQSVKAHPGAGNAIYKVDNLQIEDYHNFDNSFSGGTGDPAIVSFEVRWFLDVGQRANIKNEEGDFGAEFVRAHAQMAWSAVVGDYSFRSDPIDTSHSDFAEMGTMRNGRFFRGD